MAVEGRALMAVEGRALIAVEGSRWLARAIGRRPLDGRPLRSNSALGAAPAVAVALGCRSVRSPCPGATSLSAATSSADEASPAAPIAGVALAEPSSASATAAAAAAAATAAVAAAMAAAAVAAVVGREREQLEIRMATAGGCRGEGCRPAQAGSRRPESGAGAAQAERPTWPCTTLRTPEADGPAATTAAAVDVAIAVGVVAARAVAGRRMRPPARSASSAASASRGRALRRALRSLAPASVVGAASIAPLVAPVVRPAALPLGAALGRSSSSVCASSVAYMVALVDVARGVEAALVDDEAGRPCTEREGRLLLLPAPSARGRLPAGALGIRTARRFGLGCS